ncbi:MAG: hypothetical protein ACYS1A_15120 [Planctomycetota bacterium]
MFKKLVCLMVFVLLLGVSTVEVRAGAVDVLEDFEGYINDVDLNARWPYSPWPSGSVTISLLTNPADAHGGSQAMRWAYDTAYREWVDNVYVFDSPVDLSQYSEVRLWVKVHSGSDLVDSLFVRFFNGPYTLPPDPAHEPVARTEFGRGQGPYVNPGQWFEWVIDLDNITYDSGVTHDDLTDVRALLFGEWGGNAAAQGIIDIDDITLVRGVTASGPSPGNNADNVEPDAVLGWTAGYGALSHDVYFGTSESEVTNANNSLPVGTSVYKGNQLVDANTYDPVGGLESEQDYHWRIDEVNGGTITGTVWSFTVKQYIAADFSGDYSVDLNDVNLMALQWLETGQGLEADGNFDGTVNLKDHAVLAEDWLFEIQPPQNECENWQILHPEWIFCDDFEVDTAFVREGRYFEYDSDGGDFVPVEGLGIDGSKGMRVVFQNSEVGAGGFKLGFGRNPSGGMNRGIRENEDFREIYYRMYLKMQDGWTGSPAKLSRATIISASDWSQAMIGHLWSSGDYLLVDPVRCVDPVTSLVKCVGYNDFPNMDWIGNLAGVTPIFDSVHDGIWYCVEARVKLNDPGQANGIQDFWIDGNLEARRAGLNFVAAYTDYAINAIFFENWWNSGSPQLQERYFDNIVVSTQPIGCLE